MTNSGRLRRTHFRALLLETTALLFCAVVAVPVAAQSGDASRLPSRPVPFQIVQLVTEPEGIVLSLRQIQELDQWVRDFAAWQQWADRWLNRRQPGKWVYAVDRQKKPDPPLWLPDVCDMGAGDDDLVQACELLSAWHDDPIAARNHRAAVAVLAKREDDGKSVWWRHLHVDGLWSTTQSSVSAFGVFGVHMTIEVEGRFQVFVAPGIMMVSVPTFSGTRDLAPATDWGVTYRLFNVGRNTVNFNFVHAWMLSNRPNLVDSNLTLAGFSVSFRPRPR